METSELISWLWRVSWQASVLVLLVLLAQWLFRAHLAPRWRYALWFLVLARLALPVAPESSLSIFNFATVDAAAPAREAPRESVAPRSARQPEMEIAAAEFAASELSQPDNKGAGLAAPASNRETTVAEPAWSIDVATVLLAIYSAGAFILLLRLTYGNVRFARRLRNRPPVTDPAVLRVFERCRKEIGVRRDLTILEAPEVESPALFGLFRLRLLVPRGFLQSFSAEELRHVFLHELSHVRRGDVFVNRIIAILQAMHWFNPVLWFGFRRMRADRELACDALALSRIREGENTAYGQTVLKLLEGFTRPPAVPGLVGIMEEKSQMKTRMRLIAQFRDRRGWSVVAIGLLAVLAVVCLTDAKGPAAVAGEGEKDATKAVTEAQSYIRFRILDESDHRPLANARLEGRLEYYDERESYSIGPYATNENGEAEISHPVSDSGGLRITVSHEGFVPKRFVWSIGNMGPVPESHTMKLGAGIRVGGILHDEEEGAPVEGAKVDIKVNTGMYAAEEILILRGTIVATTDESGRWSADGLPKELRGLRIRVTHPEYGPRTFSTGRRHASDVLLRRQDLGAQEAAMVVKKNFAIEGRVIDGEGEPVGEATVHFGDSLHFDDSEFYGPNQTVVTSADGRFAFRTGEGPPTNVFALKEGYGIAFREIVPSPELDDLEIRLPSERALSGRVVDPEGNAVSGATVVPDDWRLFDWRGTTDTDGGFVWDPAPGGEVKLSIHKAGFLPLHEHGVRAGEEEQTIVMSLPPRISGRVVDAETGANVQSFRVLLGEDRAGEPGKIYWTTTESFEDASGEYALQIPQPSQVPLLARIEALGYLPKVSERFTMREEGRRIDFELTKAEPIRGAVLSPEGRPLAGVEAALVGPHSRLELGKAQLLGPARGARGATGGVVQSDAEGRFALIPDPEAVTAVFVHDRGYAEIPAARFPTLENVDLQLWGSIEGVVTIGDEPGVDEEVVLNPHQNGLPAGVSYNWNAYRTTTDAHGRFTVDYVPPGNRSIQRMIQTSPGGARSSSHSTPVEVKPGEVAKVEFGRTGRTIVGRLVADDPEREVNWMRSSIDIFAFGAGSFTVIKKADGGFRAESVPAGEYYFEIRIYDPESVYTDPNPPVIGTLSATVTVPEMPDGRDDEPLDLGEFTVVFE